MNAALRFLLGVIVRHLRLAGGQFLIVGWAVWRLLLEILRLAGRPSVVNPVLLALALGIAVYAASLWLLVLQ